MSALRLALDRLDALAERDNQPRLVIYPVDGGGHWTFTDTHLLFRFPRRVPVLDWLDLSRWLRVEPDRARHGVMDGALRHGFRVTLTGAQWRGLIGPLLAPDASRWGEAGLDIVRICPANVRVDTRPISVAVNTRLLRVAMMPADPEEPVACDVANDQALWLHGRDWLAAVARLLPPPVVRSERVIAELAHLS